MTAGSVESRAPVLVLGLGNLLLSDDGVGLRLLEMAAGSGVFGDEVEFVDGGTQGLALLGVLSGRRLAVVLDAVALGAAAGTIHVLRQGEIEKLRVHRAATAHEGNALELLAAARLVGEEPGEVVVVGVESASFRTGTELSEAVAAAVPRAAGIVVELVKEGLCALPSQAGSSMQKS